MVLALPLLVGFPSVSVPLPDKSKRQQWLIRAHLLSQAGERERGGRHSWGVRGVPATAEAVGKLPHSEAGFMLPQVLILDCGGLSRVRLPRLPGKGGQ